MPSDTSRPRQENGFSFSCRGPTARTEAREERVRDRLRELGLRGLTLTEHLEGDDWARLTLSADIFVHAQSTDAASASMQEHLYAGAVVFNGSWLRYDDLLARGADFRTFTGYVDLAEQIEQVVAGGLEDALRQSRARNAVLALSSWDAVREEWLPPVRLIACDPHVGRSRSCQIQAQYAPTPLATARIVRHRIMRSPMMDQFST